MTRAIILEVIDNKGVGIRDAVENILCRFGGWDTIRGISTIKRVYQQLVIDKYVDRMKLSYGREASDEEWLAKKREFLGDELCPAESFPSDSLLPLVIKQFALRDLVYLLHVQRLDVSCMCIMAKGKHDFYISPIHRYVPDRDVFVKARSKNGKRMCVQLFEALRHEQRGMWNRAIERARALIIEHFLSWCALQSIDVDVSVSVSALCACESVIPYITSGLDRGVHIGGPMSDVELGNYVFKTV